MTFIALTGAKNSFEVNFYTDLFEGKVCKWCVDYITTLLWWCECTLQPFPNKDKVSLYPFDEDIKRIVSVHSALYSGVESTYIKEEYHVPDNPTHSTTLPILEYCEDYLTPTHYVRLVKRNLPFILGAIREGERDPRVLKMKEWYLALANSLFEMK